MLELLLVVVVVVVVGVVMVDYYQCWHQFELIRLAVSLVRKMLKTLFLFPFSTLVAVAVAVLFGHLKQWEQMLDM